MMKYDIFLDIAAICVILVLILAAKRRHVDTGMANRVFLQMMVLNLLTAISDILTVIPDTSNTFVWITCVIYYALQISLMPVLTIYIVAVVEAFEHFKRRKNRIIFSAPYAVLALLLLSSPLTKLIFTVEDGQYYHGPFFFLTYVVMFFYMGYMVYYNFTFKRNMKLSTMYCIYSVFPFIFASLVLQLIWNHVLMHCFIVSLCLFFYAVTIQRPEALMDNETDLYSEMHFMSEMKRAIKDRRKLTLCLFKIEKYEHYMASLSIEKHSMLLRSIAQGLLNAMEEVDSDFDVYYLKHGLYAIQARSDLRGKVEQLMSITEQEILKSLDQASMMMVTPNMYKCVVRLPEDIADFNALPPFLDSMESILPRSGPIYYLAKMENQDMISMHININAIIERALNNGEFSVKFAPIFEPVSERIVAGSSAISLNDNRYGDIPQYIIWRAAERSGEIDRLTDMVYERVCRFIAGADFKESGLRYIQMRLSVTSFQDQYLCSKLMDRARRYNISPTQIAFALAETSEIEDWSEVAAQCQLLRMQGFKVGLDDYGEYNSNIRRLALVPFTAVQLDPTLVQRAMSDQKDNSGEELVGGILGINQLILRSTVDMIDSLDIKVIAGGVDDKASYELVRELGCEYAMGDYFGEYLPMHDFLHQVREVNKKVDH